MASKGITVEVTGMKEALATLQQMGPKAQASIGPLLTQFANTKVVTEAKKLVPVLDGGLKGSIQALEPVTDGQRISVKVVAGGVAAPYALAVHENPRAGKTGGVSPSGKRYARWATVGQWKYLEIPAMAAAKESAQWFANAVRGIMKRWGK
jgi:hypothetical protein